MANKKTSSRKTSKGIKWSRTRYTGVRYWESETRKFRGRPDKCFVIRYKKHGRTFSETIGWQSENITQEFCSNLRGEITSNIKTGQGFQSLQEKRDLETARIKAAKSEAVTLQQAFDAFLDTRPLKAQTSREYQRSMQTAFADWKNRKVLDISRDAVSKRHQKLKNDALKNFLKKCKEKELKPTKNEIEKRGGAQANLHMRFLRSLLNFCAGYYEDANGGPLLKHNPVERLSQTKQWYRVPRRQTIIPANQVPAWFQAIQNLENKNIKDYLIFLFLTGSRREEGLTLEINQINLKNRSYTLIDPKNRQDITLPIPEYLFKIVEERIRILNGFKYLFPGTNRDGKLNPKTHLKEPRAQVLKVIKESKVKFTLHDLRRVFITQADAIDLSLFAMKRLVNHSIGSDITSGYVVSDVERLRGPMQKIEDRLLFLAEAKEKGKIIKFNK